MAYRNSPMKPRRFTFAGSVPTQRMQPRLEDIHTEEMKNDVEIPLPNKVETPGNRMPEEGRSRRFPGFPLFKQGINLEEILLIGLIILMLDEGIQDEFLLLMLVYILLAG